ncbi:MAG TPA: cytochrome b/b6 domain-containing protein [Noviherbaspirillum sp.]|nr:cytochrome b/b6 domain-containing protein [Noviherbaspirillum sp.]
MKKIRVWDLPLRLFHWTLAALLVAAWVTQYIGGNAMDWHFRIGYAVLVLILFRIVWGFIGPRYARFSSFLYGPSAIAGYLRGHPSQRPGHNPLGSLSVFALIGVVFAQALSGMFTNDDIFFTEGPLARYISKDLSDWLTWFHRDVSVVALYVMVALHLAAIAWYVVVKRKRLIRPMFTGDQEVEEPMPGIEAARDDWKTRLLAVTILGGLAALMIWIVTLPRTYL